MKNFYKVFDRLIGQAEDLGLLITFAAIVCIVVAHVFFRYVLVSGILWSDELVQILLVYMVMFGCARAVRTNGHTELNGFANKLPLGPRVVVRALIAIVCIGFLVLFLFSAIAHTADAGNLKTVILRIPRAYCYLSMPLGAALTLYEFLKTVKYRIIHDPKDDDFLVEETE